jgi:peptide-methionine (R)-S-oxide reductase
MERRGVLACGVAAVALAMGLATVQRRPARAATAAPFPVTRSDGEWRRLLTPEQYQVLRHEATEAPESSPLDHEFRPGTYACAGCGKPNFSSATKFNSHTGWPSFYAPLDGAVQTQVDHAFFMTRTEVHCSECGGHLGHVFDDGPRPTGLRYCMNGVALTFARA